MLSPAPSIGSRVPDSVVALEALGTSCVFHFLRVGRIVSHVGANRAFVTASAAVLVAVVEGAWASGCLAATSAPTSSSARCVALTAAAVGNGWRCCCRDVGLSSFACCVKSEGCKFQCVGGCVHG